MPDDVVVLVEEVLEVPVEPLLEVLVEVEVTAAASTAITQESVVPLVLLLLHLRATSTPGKKSSMPLLVCLTEAVRLSSKVMTLPAF